MKRLSREKIPVKRIPKVLSELILKVALIQFNPKVGDVENNCLRMIEFVSEATRRGAELVIFPELATMGYPPRDLLEDANKIRANVESLDRIAKSVKTAAVVCGFVEPRVGTIGKPFFNSVALITENNVKIVGQKQLLPYYDVFEEERFFESGIKSQSFEFREFTFGVTVCEDVWNFPEFLVRTYPKQPLDDFKKISIDFLINLSASPFSLDKPALRRRVFSHAATYLGVPVLSAGQVGGNDQLLFDGSTMALDAKGEVFAGCEPFIEKILYVELNDLRKNSAAKKLPWPEKSEAWLYDALKMGLRDYLAKCGATGVCLGLSGGIDSSVCAAIAADAVGPKNVETLGLPTRFTASESFADAQRLADRLKIGYTVFSIETIFSAIQTELSAFFKTAVPSVTWENIQPRLRMTILMAVANARNLFLLNTSNKSEIATGFSTLYGDSAGALSLLGDVTKTQVYQLAEYINRHAEIIPKRVITRAPSAELKDHQVDQDVLPPYPVLDALIQSFIVDKKAPVATVTIDQPAIEKFLKLYGVSEYKRGQLSPALRVSSRAFGIGRRMPIAALP